MLKKVKEAIARFALLKDNCHITVALSGGADSMALLYALIELKDELKIKNISAAHFNHKIRGDEALRDESFVKKQCQNLGINLILGNADVPQFAKDNHLSLELAARQLRYDFFNTIDTDFIATAHTASDNIETVIFNLTRGTALSGLCGIPPIRERYIRPLILCTRDDIENYCNDNKIDFVTDSTNLSDDYTRNKIRHQVVPILKTVNQSAENAVARMAASVREDEDFINIQAQERFENLLQNSKLNISHFDKLHPAIAKRVIAKYCNMFNVEVDSLHINEMYDICKTDGKISISGNKYAIAQNGVLTIEEANKNTVDVEFKVNITECDNDLFKNCKKVHNLLLKNIIDCDKIVGCLSLRTRRSGDSIRLKNKNCTKTLKKLFCEYKIPLNERQNLPVISDSDGVVWVHKIGVADRVAADEQTKKVFKIKVEKL